MVKRKRGYNWIFVAISALLALMGAMFMLSGSRYSALLPLTAVGLIVCGILYLLGTSYSSGAVQDWALVQGLTDILLAIVLFTSVSFSLSSMMFTIFAIWAFAGVAGRVISLLRANVRRTRALISAGLCLAACLVFLSGAFFPLMRANLCLGAGLLVYAVGSALGYWVRL